MTFRNSGILGPAFEFATRFIRAQMEGRWNQIRQGTTLPSYPEALNQFTPTAFWIGLLIALRDHFQVPMEQVNTLWGTLRHSFRPALDPIEAVLQDRSRCQMFNMLTRLEASLEQNPACAVLQEMTRMICFGPWTDEQAQYVLTHYRETFEVGAGNGYGIWSLRDHGIDASGCDTNAYGTEPRAPGAPAQEPIMDLWRWSGQLESNGWLLRGGVELLATRWSKTLVLSWPQPGSSFPAEALRAYREAGGATLLLKVGGLVGVKTTNRVADQPTGKERANLLAFFDELSKHWGPPKQEESPPYDPWLSYNNLWAFQVR